MATIEYKLNGRYRPFMATLRSNNITGTIVDSEVLPNSGALNSFTNVPIGSYFVVGYDRAFGVVSSSILNVTAITTTLTTTLTTTTTTTTTTTAGPVETSIDITFDASTEKVNCKLYAPVSGDITIKDIVISGWSSTNCSVGSATVFSIMSSDLVIPSGQSGSFENASDPSVPLNEWTNAKGYTFDSGFDANGQTIDIQGEILMVGADTVKINFMGCFII